MVMQNTQSFTKKKPGSLAELMYIILPLMMVSFSENMMVFFDRIILSHYSLISFNSVTLASQFIEVFEYAIWSLAGISEIMVARLYAQKKISQLSVPCWQMIYLSLALFPVMAILSFYTAPLVLHGAYLNNAGSYYKVMLYTVPLLGIIAALSGFFIGQGKIKLVLISSLVVNIINLCLDIVLVFGFSPYIPKLGPLGTAISAVIALSIQCIWMFSVYLKKSNRKLYGTHEYRFNFFYFKKCIKLGLPLASGHVGEMLGWVVIIKLISHTSLVNFTIVSAGSTLYLLFDFVIEGIFRGLSAMIGFYHQIGRRDIIKQAIQSSLVLFLFIILLLAVLLIIFPHLVIHVFNLSKYPASWVHPLRVSFIFIWIYFLFLGSFWLYSSIKIAKNSINFTMFINVMAMWICAVLPIYFICEHYSLRSLYIWPIIDCYIIVACLLIWLRSLRQAPW
jgi:MATE family multidrug resistance protein